MSWRHVIQSIAALAPAWWVWNPGGGGGGISTVHTDGVTIQGDGSLATPVALLDAITDGTSLAGAGIAANKLRIVPDTYFTFGNVINFTGTDHNFIFLVGFAVPTPVQFSHITFGIAGFDAAPATVDAGVYSASGNLLANIGSQSLTGGGVKTFSIVQGTVTLPIGRYYQAWSNSTDGFSLYGDSQTLALYYSSFGAAAPTPGTLPATIAPPAFAVASNSIGFALS